MGKYKGFYRKSPPPGAAKRTSVQHYILFSDRIIIEFREGEIYTYSYETTGSDTVEAMRQLARSGQGLNRFINAYQPGYDLGYVPPEGSEAQVPMEVYGGR